MTGYGVLGLCYGALADAEAAHCAGSFPQSTASGAVVSCVSSGPTGLQLQRTDETGVGAPYTVAVVYAPCDFGQLPGAIPPDSSALGYAWGVGFSGVLTCYLVAWACARVLEQIKN